MKFRNLLIIGLGFFAAGVFYLKKESVLAASIVPQRTLASNPVPTTTNKNSVTQKKTPLNEIKELQACYQSNACDFPQTDPRSYDIALGHKIADRLKQLRGSLSPSELGELARHTMKIEDGFVQSAALDIFKDLPTSADNLQALKEGLQNNTDPLIAEKALPELQRYIGTGQEAGAQQVVQTMLQGAHFASEKAGENILSFINEKSFSSYQQLQQQMPAQSRVARDLETALSEYRKQRSGG